MPTNVQRRRGRTAAKSAGRAMVKALDLAMRAGREARRAHEAMMHLSRERAAEQEGEGASADE